MNIFGAIPNYTEVSNVKSTNKSTTNGNNYTGPSFGESIREIAKSAKMEVVNGSAASSLQLTRQKEGFDKPFDFKKAEEELAEDYVGKLQKMMEKMKK